MHMGQTHGEALRDEIQGFVDQRLVALGKYLNQRNHRLRMDEFMDITEQSMAAHGVFHPGGMEEHHGISEGARVDTKRLYLAANMTDMRDAHLLSAPSGPPMDPTEDPDGCSAVLVPASLTQEGHPIAGQTWDLNPTDLPFVTAIKRSPAGAPATWGITCVGCLTLMAINEHGLCVGTTNLKTYGSRPGVGYLGTLHAAIGQTDAQTASDTIRSAPPSGAHSFWLADAGNLIEWELSATHRESRNARDQAVVRTNHCLLEPNRAVEGESPTESSRRRLETLSRWAAEGGVTVGSMRAAFSDRSQGACSVNRYPEDGTGTATNAVVIMEPTERRIHACRGPADRGLWITETV